MSDLIAKLATYLSPASLQFDLAAALVALVALLFSIITFVQQRRIILETLRIQRDNDVIGWLNQTIEILVGIEFFLRDASRPSQQLQFGSKRDEFLARLSGAIDKGRLYGLRLDGVWIHVGTPQGLEDADTFLGDLAREP